MKNDDLNVLNWPQNVWNKMNVKRVMEMFCPSPYFDFEYYFDCKNNTLKKHLL